MAPFLTHRVIEDVCNAAISGPSLGGVRGGLSLYSYGLHFGPWAFLVLFEDLNFLWIGRGSVGKWSWACVLGGFNDKGSDLQ